jgi:uncharacterized SAM-binding protein YcdF (DUF218 family)
MSGKRRKNWFSWLLAAGAFIAVLLAGMTTVFYGAGEFLVHADELQRSGAVVLLSGGDTERLDEAALLMRDRYADLLLLTDTDQLIPDGMLAGMPVGQYMRLELISRGVSPAQIELTHQVVGSTRDEAHAVREFMQRHKVSSCIVVTDPFHTRRTRIIFMQEMEGSGIDVRVVPARVHWYRAGTWFITWRGWQATVSEYLKLGALYF